MIPARGATAMALAQKLTDLLDTARLNLAITSMSALFANRFNGYGNPDQVLTPEQLEECALAGRNIVLEELVQVPPMHLMPIRHTFGGIADDFRRQHATPDGRTWHPYMLVLQHDNLADFPDHKDVILRHLDWYRACLDEAIDWLVGPSPRQ